MMTMIIGVISFSFASGSLASILQNVDSQTAAFEHKVEILNRIQKEYYLPLDLYTRLKQSLRYNQKKDIEELNHFVEELPHKLKIEVSIYLHEKTYKLIPFLQNRSNSFKAWICPLLKPYLVLEKQFIYSDDDEITHIYFLREGKCAFVLPKHDNAKYINVTPGCFFGIIDIVGSVLKKKDGFKLLNDWANHKELLKQ